MVSPRDMASVEFGTFVHKVSVAIGSKTQLGARVDLSEDQMLEIHAGNAHNFSEEVLRSLAVACEPELGAIYVGHMLGMVSRIHPKVDTCSLGQMRIQTPLTSAERRPQLVG